MKEKKLLFIGLEIKEPIKAHIGEDPIGVVKGFTQHITLAFMPNDDIINVYKNLMGKEYPIALKEYALSESHEGIKVELPKTLPYYNNSIPHITIGTTANAANTPCLWGENIVVNDGSVIKPPYIIEKLNFTISGILKFYYI